MALLHRIGVSFLFVLFGVPHSTLIAQDASRKESTEAGEYSFPPRCKHCPDPDFTEEAKNSKIKSASVLLSVTISAEGNPGDIQILKDSGFGLGEKAVKAVRTWKFKPAKDKDHKPIAATIKIEVFFRRLD